MTDYNLDCFVSSNVYSTLSKPWRNFLIKLLETPHLPTNNWKHHHFLAYIIYRFYQAYQRPMVLSLAGAPSKCQEIVLVKRLMAMLGNLTMEYNKKYIDWVFDCKIIPNRVRIKSMSFFLSSSLVNEFIFDYGNPNKIALVSNVISRNSVLPDNVLALITKQDLSLKTYGDLAFAKMAADQQDDQFSSLFEDLKSINFDLQILGSLK